MQVAKLAVLCPHEGEFIGGTVQISDDEEADLMMFKRLRHRLKAELHPLET